jgi:diamine N-acetyltransferase
MPVLAPAVPADAADLAAFAADQYVETFVRGFAIPYPPAELARFLEETCGEAAFARMIADPTADVRLLRDGQGVAAYAVSGPAGLPHPDVSASDGEIKRFYVRPDLQGAGLARAALEELLRDLDPKGRRTLWLSVWEGNHRAQRFYARYGFREVGDYPYPVGDWIDRDLIWRRGDARGPEPL